MAIEFDIRIIGGSTPEVMQDLKLFAANLSSALGVAPSPANTTDTAPLATTATTATAAVEGNGADKPATTSRKRSTAKPEPEKTNLDRAAIIDGLTKIYSKGDEDVRLAITKFRDGQGADRLRDLKDDALPAAAELLIELKTAADQPSV